MYLRAMYIHLYVTEMLERIHSFQNNHYILVKY
jgi:hypothetical protein